jgi:hypothetical protein
LEAKNETLRKCLKNSRRIIAETISGKIKQAIEKRREIVQAEGNITEDKLDESDCEESNGFL